MKLGVLSLAMPEYYPSEALDLLKEIGYDGVQWCIGRNSGDRTNPTSFSGNRCVMTPSELVSNASELRQKAERLGLSMVSVAGFTHGDLDWIDECMRATVAIGAKNICISPGYYDEEKGNFRKQMSDARVRYAKIAQMATQYGLQTLLETDFWDGQLGSSTYTACAILEGLDPKHVGILWDPADQVVDGGELYRVAVETAGEYLAEVHAMNICWLPTERVDGRMRWKWEFAPVREGQVDWPAVIQVLKHVNYDGWIYFEELPAERTTEEILRENLAWFRELIDRI